MMTRYGMSYKKGDILLISFPFTDLKNSKKRPVLVIKDENSYGDIVCLQITSNSTQTYLKEINQVDFNNKILKIKSYIKYDKCFTLDSKIVDKKLSSINSNFLEKLKSLFCNTVF